jgi:hypothetical protein
MVVSVTLHQSAASFPLVQRLDKSQLARPESYFAFRSNQPGQQGAYVISIRGCKRAYPIGAFDFLAAYLIPLDLWYIVPEERVQGKITILLYPNSKRSKFQPYRESWELLTGGETADQT